LSWFPRVEMSSNPREAARSPNRATVLDAHRPPVSA